MAGLRAQVEAKFLGRTVEASKNTKKYCYTFIQGDKLVSDTSGKQRGMYLDPQVLTFWTTDDIRTIGYEENVKLDVEVVGDSVVVKNIVK